MRGEHVVSTQCRHLELNARVLEDELVLLGGRGEELERLTLEAALKTHSAFRLETAPRP